METAIGIWKDRHDLGSAEDHIRRLRNGSRGIPRRFVHPISICELWHGARRGEEAGLTPCSPRNRKHYPMRDLDSLKRNF